EKPGDSQRAYLLDLVMMTHGWRRFTWEDIRREDALQELKFERESGLYVKGYTSKSSRKKRPIKSKVMLNFLNNDLTQEEVVTEDDGRFAFGPYLIQDSLAVIIQARRYKGENEKDFLDGNRKLNINIEDPQFLNLKKPIFKEQGDFDLAAYQKFINSNKYSQFVKDQYNDMEVRLSEVVVKAKRKTKEDEIKKIVAQNSIYLNPSNRIIVDEDFKITNRSVFELLRNVPGVNVQGSLNNPTVTIRGGNAILFLLDGFPVDPDFINLININDVLVVDVLKGPSASIFGSRGGDGVIAIYTGTDPDSNRNSNVTRRKSGIVDLVVKGFDKNRQFYSPDYAMNASSITKPDVRTTLYWNPYVLLSKGKDTSMSFFTGDNTGEYIVITEGLSEDGKPIFNTYEFSVQEND
ncbi:MAG: Plug domain-containing protein, partial [Bacteroidota bacterium]